MTAVVAALVCKECGRSGMWKSGKAWSGRNQCQRYQCPQCGHIQVGEALSRTVVVDGVVHSVTVR